MDDDYFGPAPRTDEELDTLTGSQLSDVLEDLAGSSKVKDRKLRENISRRLASVVSEIDESY